ncbi:MAG: glycosyltransferase family 2 protein [Candidatus Omnitrophica bacterium]|nr:glycosyltransferase family 2 protein [Candidatus Omnitrophota bacterium]
MLSIIIPCFNEADNIPVLIERINGCDLRDTEVILVNNGSTDQTRVVLNKQIEKSNLRIKCVNLEKNQGYGFGIMRGINAASGDIIAWTHADLQTDIRDVFDGYKLLLGSGDLKGVFLKGSRKNRSLIDYCFTWGMGLLASVVLHQKLFDVNAQPKMFHRSFLSLMKDMPADFSLDLYAFYLARKNGLHILELPVYFNRRIYGQAKGGGSFKTKWKLVYRTWKYIFKLKHNLKNSL